MKIDTLILGAYETNCYVLRSDHAAKDCLVVDPGLEAGSLIEFLEEHALNPVGVVLTHGHIDHIAGLAALRERFAGTKVYIHTLDAKMLTDPYANLSAMHGMAFTTEPEEAALNESDVIEQAGITLRVLHTPGALLVKEADLAHNADPERLAVLDEPVRKRLTEKYARMRSLLGLFPV